MRRNSLTVWTHNLNTCSLAPGALAGRSGFLASLQIQSLKIGYINKIISHSCKCIGANLLIVPPIATTIYSKKQVSSRGDHRPDVQQPQCLQGYFCVLSTMQKKCNICHPDKMYLQFVSASFIFCFLWTKEALCNSKTCFSISLDHTTAIMLWVLVDALQIEETHRILIISHCCSCSGS